MKKYLFILLATIAFVACSNDESAPSNTIAPVADNKMDTAVKAFFGSELPDSLPDGRNKFGFDFVCNGMPRGVPDVQGLIINSQEELAGLYGGDKEVPLIDFSAYSLVIGQIVVMWEDWTTRIELQEEEDFLKLTAHLHDKRGITTWEILSFDYFWHLYPKLPDKPLQVWVEAE